MRREEGQKTPDRDEEAALWFLEVGEDALSPERQRDFDTWITEPENDEAFQRAADIWGSIDDIATTPELLRMRSDSLQMVRRGNLRRWQRSRLGGWAKWGMLGTAAAAAMLLFLVWSATTVENFRTGVGELRVATLSDGSRVSLDADSAVEARYSLLKRQMVLTKGRAKFDVAHNALRPFTVDVGDKQVIATGTSFSVEMLGAKTYVVLLEGHVALRDRNGKPLQGNNGEDLENGLAPGHEAVVDLTGSGPVSIGISHPSATVSWQTGQMNIDDEPLPLAVERMNRYLHEPMVVANGRAADVRVSGVFDGHSPDGFLDSLRELSGVRVERRDGKVYLMK